MERISDIARGYCVVRVIGAEPAQFLEFCAAREIPFWGACPEDEFTLIVSMRLEDAALAELAAERCCCEADILERKGGRTYIKRLSRRYALIILPLVLLALLIFSSFFVWDIEVTGNETVTETEIINALAESGVGIGSYWPTFTNDLIRSEVMLKIPELKWITVCVYGSRICVDVRERTEIPELFDEEKFSKVVAEQSGIIDSMSVLQGFPLFLKGQTVVTGDELISGVIDSELSDTRIVHASGEVSARTWYEMSGLLPMDYTKKAYTGKTRDRLSLVIGEKRAKFYRNSGNPEQMCDNIITEHYFGIKGIFTLPVALVRDRAEIYELADAQYSEKEAAALLEARLRAELLAKIGEKGKVISAEFTMSLLNGTYVGTLRAECTQIISAEKPLTEEEINAAKSAGEEQTPE